MADAFSLPNQDLKRPEFDETLTLEKVRDYLRDLASQSEDNFKAIKGASFAQQTLSRYLSAQSTNSASGSLSADIAYTDASITLTPGSWVVRVQASAHTTDTVDSLSVGVWNQTASAEVSGGRGPSATPSAINYRACLVSEVEMSVTADTQICPLICRNGSSTLGASSAAGGIVGRITATRR